jgi:hypothetical protein
MTCRQGGSLPKFVAGVGVFRTLTCGGWTYVTSTDHHLWHDIFMIGYLVATIPWTLGCLALSPPNRKALKWRKIFGGGFFLTLIPLTYWFLQHKIHHRSGGKVLRKLPCAMTANQCLAYTIYALFEWLEVLLDVAFDACTLYDFSGLEVVITDVTGITRGYVNWLPK